MAKIKLQGHASGTGVITVTAPNTSTDRTITLPDSTGTILDTTSTLDATKLSGALPAISGANLTSLPADATKLPLAGGTMTGVLNMGTADTVSTNNKIIFGKAVTASQSYLPVIQQGSPDGAGVDLILATTSGTGAVRIFTGNSGTSGVPFASSNTEKLSILSDGRGLSQFTAKAWGRVNMSNMTLTDSHNVSSVTDVSTGRAGINFTNAMANANYSTPVSATEGYRSATKSHATGSFTINHTDTNGNLADANGASFVVFGD